MNTTVTRYDTAFYVQALDRFVATGECAETDTEPLYAYLLSVMNDSMVKVQVLGDEVCARIFYDTMIQFIQLNLEKERYNLRKSQSERTGMKLVLEWSMAKRKDGWQALLQQISDKYREYGFDSRFYRSHFGTEGGYADDEVWEKMVDDWEDAFQLKMHEEKEKEIAFRKDALERRLRSNHGNVRVDLPQQADGGGCRRVAGHDDGLGSGAYQMLRRRKAQRLDLRFALDAVGRVERVAVVQIVFLRQQPHRLAQDADPTEAGVKKRNRPILLLHTHASKNRTISFRSYSPPSMLMRSVRSGGRVLAHSS